MNEVLLLLLFMKIIVTYVFLGRKRKIDDREGTSKLIITDVYRERQASKIQRTSDGGMKEGFRK